jgi:ABC-type multidrug transport system fused ATPase/permease subunit
MLLDLLGSFYDKNKLIIIMYFVIVFLLLPIEAVIVPELYGKLFDTLKEINKFPSIFDVFNNVKAQNFAGVLAMISFVWFISLIFNAMKYFYESDIVPKFQAYIRTSIYEKTINAFSNEFEHIKTGEYLSRMMELARNFKDITQYGLTKIIPDLLISFFIVFYMYFKNTKIANILLVSSLLCVGVQYIGTNVLTKLISEKEHYFNTILSENIQDSLDNLMNIYINNEVNTQLNKNDEIEKTHADIIKRIMKIETTVVYITQAIILIGYIIAIIALYHLLKDGYLTNKSAIVIILILGQYHNYFSWVNSAFVHQVTYKLGIINGSKEFLEEIFKKNENKNKKNFVDNGEIQLKDVFFKHDKENNEYLFENLNMTIKGGDKVAIVGQSGAGKSTLLKLMLNLNTIESGSILIDGVPITDSHNEYLRSQVNYINQNTNLFNETVLYNMNYGNNVDEQIIIDKLKKYKLDEVFSELSDGIQSSCGVHGTNLSGGMQKVTMLIRGILKPSKIVLIDEPLSALDPETRVKVIKMIIEECKNKTLVVVTHDEEILPYMNEVIDIKDV